MNKQELIARIEEQTRPIHDAVRASVDRVIDDGEAGRITIDEAVAITGGLVTMLTEHLAHAIGTFEALRGVSPRIAKIVDGHLARSREQMEEVLAAHRKETSST